MNNSSYSVDFVVLSEKLLWITELKSLKTFNNSIANVLRLLWCTETGPSFSNRLSKDDFLLLLIKRRHLSWRRFILLLNKLWPKNAFTSKRFFGKSMLGVILDDIFDFCLAFFMSFIWEMKLNFEYNFISSNFLHLMFFIILFSIVKLTSLFQLHRKWHLTRLAFIWLSLNHWKSIFNVLSDFSITFPIELLVMYGVSILRKSRWHEVILNNRDLSIDPCKIQA